MIKRRLSLFALGCLAASVAAFAPVPVFKAPKAITNSIQMKLVPVPAGEFLMGSTEGERKTVMKEADLVKMPMPDWLKAEGPQRKVKITKAFYMGVYEVTQGEYEKIMGKNPSYYSLQGTGKAWLKGDASRLPVDQVTYKDAVQFCEKLTARAGEKGRVYRLPTEAEWEYACRAGTKTANHFGDSLSSDQANFVGDYPSNGADKKLNHPGGPSPVGSYKPNAFGLYDMHGNVLEWCSDWYDKDYYGKGGDSDPQGPPKAQGHVLRSASHSNPGYVCRSACRMEGGGAETRSLCVGFRVVLVLPNK